MKKMMVFVYALLVFSGFQTVSQAAEPVAIHVGEKHEYAIEWLGMTAGKFNVEVTREDVFNGRPVYVIEMTGHTSRLTSLIYRIKDRFVSYVDKETLVPLKLEVSRREGFYRKESVTIFDHTKGKAYFHNAVDNSSKEYDIPANVQDIISVFYRLRSQRVTLNKELQFNVDFSETVFCAFGIPTETQTIKLANGKKVEAYYTEPRATVGTEEVKAGSVKAYFTSDAYKVPVLISLKAPLFTKITATLVGGVVMQ